MHKSKNILLILFSVLTVVAIFLTIIYGGGLLKRVTADFRGETDQIEQTKADGSYRIAAYEAFYDRCASVQSLESKIRNLVEELEGTDEEQRQDILNTSITASKNKRVELISAYNADARKEATQGQFKSSDLPYELDENKEETVCEVY